MSVLSNLASLHCVAVLAGLLLTTFYPLNVTGAEATPKISIVIDDIGYRLRDDIRALALPGPVTYAILPHSPHAERMATMAYQQGKDIILHLPMEAVENEKNRLLGPGALTLNMTLDEFQGTLGLDLSSLPSAIGVNNHMGSLLTRHPGHMEWLMEMLKVNGKFYLDSVTSRFSVARKIADEKHVPYLRRDVFLDNHQDAPYINEQFDTLLEVARRKGQAIGIGHPHPQTVEVLGRKLRQLGRYGVVQVSVRDLLTGIVRSRKQTSVGGAASSVAAGKGPAFE